MWSTRLLHLQDGNWHWLHLYDFSHKIQRSQGDNKTLTVYSAQLRQDSMSRKGLRNNFKLSEKVLRAVYGFLETSRATMYGTNLLCEIKQFVYSFTECFHVSVFVRKVWWKHQFLELLLHSESYFGFDRNFVKTWIEFSHLTLLAMSELIQREYNNCNMVPISR